MKFAVFGTGGVGGYFGGRLAKAGLDVTFIARGAHLNAILESGLKVDSIGGDFVVTPAKATDTTRSVGDVDYVLVTVKGWQLAESVEQLKPLVKGTAVLLPLMNGIEHMDLLINTFGADHVLGGLCRISSFIGGPGHISHVGVKPYISFGELNCEKSDRVKNLFDVFSTLNGIDVEVPDDITVAMWAKFILICATSGVGAVTRQPFGVFRNIPESRSMLRSTVEETFQVGRKKGVALPEETIEKIMERIDGFPETMVASMQKDIIEGRPSELESQNGAVVRMGRSLGIPTPTHDIIYASLLPMEIQVRSQGE